MKKLITLLLGLTILAAGIGYALYQKNVNYVLDETSSDRISIDVPQGSHAKKIGELLKEQNLIHSVFFFQVYVDQNDLGGNLQSGRFVIQKNNTLEEIVDVLANGKGAEVAVTLLEGWTAEQIGEELEAQGLTTAESFMNCINTCEFGWNILPLNEENVAEYIEGYLYPDTYFVNPVEYTNELFIDRLINTLDSKLTEEDWQGIEASPYSLEEIIIMASIVEREERNDAELARVAGVLWNRVEAGTLIGADATVLYALGRTSGGLTYNDLQFDSPYNTRKNLGLPPTPISNPGLSSIRAAIFPEETDYFYYLHDSEGGIHYGRTLEEHNMNKAKHL